LLSWKNWQDKPTNRQACRQTSKNCYHSWQNQEANIYQNQQTSKPAGGFLLNRQDWRDKPTSRQSREAKQANKLSALLAKPANQQAAI
jgi:hypothetical protein